MSGMHIEMIETVASEIYDNNLNDLDPEDLLRFERVNIRSLQAALLLQ